ncbi:PAS domain S-box protein [Salinarchaeum sp. IM2453]|uniref:PAS domain-containing sensor histidine kinase n=1 Tax=Salinarchaeum sp. IM2453 TaxID=2862870 RepID=UPI001C8389E1|nr:HAMP domain-containing sensor histidine kinase [Salinarchaeum sp. IM2453]QZA88185.1 PAS domain S-box protein [Salinarchaeum sp. IM2453]
MGNQEKSNEVINTAGSDSNENEEVYQRIFDTVDDSIFLINVEETDGEYVFRYQRNNPSHQQRTGLSQEDLQEQTPSDLFDAQQATELVENYQRCVDCRDTINYEETIEVPAGITYWQTTLTPIIEDRQVTQIVGIARDQTEQRAYQQRLEQTQQRIELILKATTSVIYEIDPATGAVETYPTPNPVLETNIKSTDEYLTYVHPEDESLVKEEATLAEPGDSYKREYRLQTEEGIRWVSDYAQRIETGSGDDANVADIGLLIDITTQKHQQQKLRRQKERLDEFASVISHDLRNPLNVAQGRAALLEEEVESPHTDPLVESLDRIETLVEDTLALARQGETIAEVESINVTDLVGKCWNQVDTNDATLEVVDNMTVEGDFSRLQQVFENLFRNAVEHGRQDVTVRVGQLDGNDGIFVEDNGPGIPDERQDLVFDPGYSSSKDGTGFGLSIVRRIIEAHGWEITLKAEKDGGTRFEFTSVVFSDK